MSLKLYRKNGTKNWNVKGSVDGTRFERSSGTSNKKTAEKLRSKWEAALFSDKSTIVDSNELLFSDAVTNYLKNDGEDLYVDNLLDHFGKDLVSEIDNKAVKDAAEELYPHQANSTINRYLYTPLSAIINYNASLDLCSPVRFKRLKVKKTHVKPAPKDWHNQVLPHCDQQTRCGLLFMVLTGSRITGMLEMAWADIDLDRSTAILWSGTKNNTPNVVTLPAILVQEMRLLDTDAKYVFGVKTRGAFYKRLKAICEDNEIEYVQPHRAGRHTFATELLKEGYSLAYVQKMGHWKSSNLVSDTYGHLERSDFKSGSDVLGQKFGQFNKKPKLVKKKQ